MYYEVCGRGRPLVLAELGTRTWPGDTAELLDRLGIRGADVMGWSDGGIVALTLAVRRPELVGRLVVSGANAVPGAEALDAPPAQ
jgi:pimeloyl-ACP methyl ester carboxylesterase